MRLTRLAVTLSLAIAASRLDAQAWAYPAMQIPTVSTRDYLGALVSASGTSALFQWREGLNRSSHIGLDLGLADRGGRNGGIGLFAAGNFGKQLTRASSDMPLDLLFTAGVGAAFGDGFTTLRIPFGVSGGHRFAIDNNMAITPFVHPRVSLDFVSVDAGRDGRDGDSDLSLDFDLGVDWELNRNVSFRAAGTFTGNRFSGDDGFAIGFVWRPNGLARMR
ncbi:MAG: hypothetical protein MUF00_16875 [Gemmatimonadaceae bacterium]|jgi:hypothetical protein|nr:hypothetical protein [Gemmatimonadaceae bacterium]